MFVAIIGNDPVLAGRWCRPCARTPVAIDKRVISGDSGFDDDDLLGAAVVFGHGSVLEVRADAGLGGEAIGNYIRDVDAQNISGRRPPRRRLFTFQLLALHARDRGDRVQLRPSNGDY